MLGAYNNYREKIASAKLLGDHILKVTEVSYCPIKGLELETPHNRNPKNSVNDFKLENNRSRALSTIRELALCNPWEYFCTLTISPEHYDRYNLKEYQKNLSEFIHSYNRNCNECEKVKYLLIPEMHKDGAWHMHGFLSGIKKKDLYINDNGYLGWTSYEKRFGFISFSKIRDIDRAANYITKYISKDAAKNVTALGAHLYYASKNLNRASTLYKGRINLHCDWDYVHPDGYCKIKIFDMRKDDYDSYIEVTD